MRLCVRIFHCSQMAVRFPPVVVMLEMINRALLFPSCDETDCKPKQLGSIPTQRSTLPSSSSQWKPGEKRSGNQSGDLMLGKWNPVPGFPPEVSTWVSASAARPQNAKKPNETGLLSIYTVGAMYEWRGGNWNPGPGTPNENPDTSGILR